MKKIKRLLAFGLALIMCLGMAVTASAEDGKGTIKIYNATPSKNYTAYKLFEARLTESENTDGSATGISYVATEAAKGFFEGKTDNPFQFTAIPAESGKYTVTKKMIGEGADKTEVSDTAIIEFLNGLYKEDESGSYVFADANFTTVFGNGTTAQANAEGIATMEPVDYGYYLITSELGAAVTVSSTDPRADVIDKNLSQPSFDGKGKVIVVNGEEVSQNTVNYGDKVDFKVSIASSNYDGKALITQYTISDVLDDGMSYVKTETDEIVSVEVRVEGEKDALTRVTGDEEPEQGEYKVVPKTVADGKTGFDIVIPWATGTYDENGEVIVTENSPVSYYKQASKITVTYSAVVDSDAQTNTPLKNSANFTYIKNNLTNSPEGPEDPKETETKTYGFDLVKTDAESNVLSGAEFTLYDTETAGTPIELVKVTDGNEAYYRVATADDKKDGSGVTITTTIEAGNVTIKGLAGGTVTGEGNDATVTKKSYWLEETKAPNGYNRLDVRKQVEIGNEDLDATVEANVWTEGGVQVINNRGSLLPSTGGIGTTIFYVVGGLLVAGAGILLITKKRMKKEQ